MKIFINPSKDIWNEIIERPKIDNKDIKIVVADILNDVKQNGDTAIKKYCLQFDKAIIDELKITEEEIDKAALLVDDELKIAIKKARENIEKFHRSQIEEVKEIETSKGIRCWRKSVAIEKIGLYIPGGTAPLFSTLLMLAVPAMVAGCKEITVCTPTNASGEINPVILYVAQLLGLKKIYKTGGVHAIAAMAYGTEKIDKVYKIFGPGNQYVTCAKQLVNSEGVAIDMPAGPSEIAVFADESSNPEFIASDLLSQAEHGIDSHVLLISTNETLVKNVQAEINFQLEKLSRRKIIERALNNSSFVIMDNIDNAFSLINEYAPEHLIIACDNAEALSTKVKNAGSVFLGHYSPESAGDYASGTNHTLPTNGFAKTYSGVSLDSFIKKITFQHLSKEGLKNIGEAVKLMAKAEGLDAHSNAVSIRFKN